MKSRNREYLYLKLMTFFRYFGDCLFYGYFYLYLKSRGLMESEIGLVTAITPVIGLLANPLWNSLSKNANSNRNIMRIITVLEGIFIILYTRVFSLELIALITALVAIVGTPFYNLHDGFTTTYAEVYHKNYNRIRSLGTLAYLSAILTAAVVLHLSNDNYNLLFTISGLIFISVTFWFFLIKPIDLTLIKEEKEVVRDYQKVLKNKQFWFYMSIYFILITIPVCADNYVSLYFTEHLNLSSSKWSLIYASMMVCEFVLLLILSKLKIKSDYIWMIAGITYMLRSLLLSFDLPLPFLALAALLRGVSYAFLLHANIRMISKICGMENVTTALFILSIGITIIQTLSNYLFGNLIVLVGYPIFFLIIGLVGILGNIIHLIYLSNHKFNY